MKTDQDQKKLRSNFYLYTGIITGHLKSIHDRTRVRETLLRMPTDDSKDVEAALDAMQLLINNQKLLDKDS